MWKTLSASAQPCIWPVDVTQYLNNRKYTKPGNFMCLLTKSVCYQRGGGAKNTHQFSEFRYKPLYHTSDDYRDRPCV